MEVRCNGCHLRGLAAHKHEPRPWFADLNNANCLGPVGNFVAIGLGQGYIVATRQGVVFKMENVLVVGVAWPEGSGPALAPLERAGER